MHIRVQRIRLFLLKMKNIDPLMGSKLKSKTNLQYIFLCWVTWPRAVHLTIRVPPNGGIAMQKEKVSPVTFVFLRIAESRLLLNEARPLLRFLS
jgi:hypothetical protein